jgi:hypothetical protein
MGTRVVWAARCRVVVSFCREVDLWRQNGLVGAVSAAGIELSWRRCWSCELAWRRKRFVACRGDRTTCIGREGEAPARLSSPKSAEPRRVLHFAPHLGGPSFQAQNPGVLRGRVGVRVVISRRLVIPCGAKLRGFCAS